MPGTDEFAHARSQGLTNEEAAALARVRAICVGLPEVTERLSHGEPAWFVRDKKSFLSMDSHHHGAEHYSLWCAGPFGAQDALISLDPDVFFRPPYVGHRGWLGVHLDVPSLDWGQLEAVIRDAYRTVAPPKLAALV
jgi:hypothetical protein